MILATRDRLPKICAHVGYSRLPITRTLASSNPALTPGGVGHVPKCNMGGVMDQSRYGIFLQVFRNISRIILSNRLVEKCQGVLTDYFSRKINRLNSVAVAGCCLHYIVFTCCFALFSLRYVTF